MLSFIGGGMVFSVSAYFGFYLASRLERRRNFLKAMRDAVTFMRTEIAFQKNELGHIFSGFTKSTELCGFFEVCSENLREWGIKRAWQTALDRVADNANLSADDMRVLKQLGGILGMSDVSGQIAAIDAAIAHLDEGIAGAESDCTRFCRMYRQCGVLLGVFILIIVI